MDRLVTTGMVRFAVGAIAAIGLYFLIGDLPTYYYVIGAVLIGPAVLYVLVRKHSWLQALFTGAMVTMAVAALVAVPFIAYKSAMGDFASSDPDCESFCFDNAGGTIFVSIIVLAIAAMYSAIGGFISAVIAFLIRGNPPASQPR